VSAVRLALIRKVRVESRALLRSPPGVISSLLSVDDSDDSIAAAAVRCLVEDGLIGLNRPFVDYVPELDIPEVEGITDAKVAALLCHTAGLDDIEPPEPLRLLILDAVQDPGNVGTIVRTAAALGAHAVLALPGTVDLWNAKVVRSGMGAHFHIPAINCTWDELSSFRARHGVRVWGADAGGAMMGAERPPARLGIVVGNEGAGLSEAVRSSVDRLVSIPMAGRSESLNVAVAAGILLHEVRA